MKETASHKVLKILVNAKKYKEKYKLNLIPPEYGPEGYLPIYAFQGALREGKGGSSGDRVLRNLRTKFGIPIKKIHHIWYIRGKPIRTWMYCLDCPPEHIDIENRCVVFILKANQIRKYPYQQSLIF